jgi:hypothetical protein
MRIQFFTTAFGKTFDLFQHGSPLLYAHAMLLPVADSVAGWIADAGRTVSNGSRSVRNVPLYSCGLTRRSVRLLYTTALPTQCGASSAVNSECSSACLRFRSPSDGCHRVRPYMVHDLHY